MTLYPLKDITQHFGLGFLRFIFGHLDTPLGELKCAFHRSLAPDLNASQAVRLARAPIATLMPFNFKIPRPLTSHAHRWLQADAFVLALLGYEKSQPEAGILPPARDTAHLRAMALCGPYFD